MAAAATATSAATATTGASMPSDSWCSSLRRLPGLRTTLRSLLAQKPMLRRIYVFLQGSRRGAQRCAPGWLHSWPRVVAICGANAMDPLVGILGREPLRATQIFHCDAAYRYGRDTVGFLLQAAEIWKGTVVTSSALFHGLHGGPVPEHHNGVIYQRSFLDTRLGEDAHGPCAEEIDVVTAAHTALKGIVTKVVGSDDRFGTRRLRLPRRRKGRLSDCRESLTRRYGWIWASKRLERVVLLVSLLQGETDAFLLDMTLRYAGMQTRKPDEVILLLSDDDKRFLLTHDVTEHFPGDSEVDLVGQIGNGTFKLHLPRDRRTRLPSRSRTDVSLPAFLAGLEDRAGVVTRVHSKSGAPRSFILSVLSCPDGRCGVQHALVQAFESETEPATTLTFASAERLTSERLVEDNIRCLAACEPNCVSNNWCGQSPEGTSGRWRVYDMTIRRAAGYVERVVY
eukprot:TRINITY_DN14427_c0_g1_i1.p1 TRINITY_DN14427_c0_g1~~TRINITY_DN14427_c0_g1_i1.p1  ORF type:complete len:492 (-),score=60.03 TRINITY_DN14427_c0_g1_i1:62-1423(-)